MYDHARARRPVRQAGFDHPAAPPDAVALSKRAPGSLS
jgi:hypothetical protein